MARTVFFVRHGQTDWNVEGRFQGQIDTALNAVGRGQAARNGRSLAALLDDPSAPDFVSSPLGRTRETMEILRAEMGLEPGGYRTDPRLLEVNFGDWEGHTFAELEQADPGCFARRERDKWHFLPPGGKAESYEQLAARVKPWLEGLTRDTVCVTHGGIVRAVFRLTGALPPPECAAMPVPQHRLLRLADGRLEWL